MRSPAGCRPTTSISTCEHAASHPLGHDGAGGRGLCLDLGHAVFGPFVLPRPSETIDTLIRLAESGEAASAVRTTAVQALLGWVAGCLLGAGLALLASWSEPLRYALRPVATGFLGIPPIA
jgi:NitT/TauT family transport system permease protein